MPEASDVNDQPDPERQGLLRSVFEPSSLDAVAEAVSVATEDEREIYVERIGDLWRWSLTTSGGSYPLLRIAARFLRADHHRIMIAFRTLPDGHCVLCEDPAKVVKPDAWAVVDFDGPTIAADVKARVETQLQAAQ